MLSSHRLTASVHFGMAMCWYVLLDWLAQTFRFTFYISRRLTNTFAIYSNHYIYITSNFSNLYTLIWLCVAWHNSKILQILSFIFHSQPRLISTLATTATSVTDRLYCNCAYKSNIFTLNTSLQSLQSLHWLCLYSVLQYTLTEYFRYSRYKRYLTSTLVNKCWLQSLHSLRTLG